MPAVTCTAQATLLTGRTPEEHGIVANGWLFRDTGEMRFWQQSNRLIQAEPLYVTARRRAAERGRSFRCAKLFWWFNQGAAVDWSVTPKPYYGADGNKVFGVHGCAGRPDGAPGDAAGAVPVRHVLGADGRPALYAVDRPLRRRGAARGAARPDAGLPAAPGLRPAALRPGRLRHAAAGPRTGRRLRPAAGRGPGGGRAGVGGERVRPRRCKPSGLSQSGAARRPGC